MPNSHLATPSQTIAVLERHGLWTKKGLGQHFLIDDNVVGRILEMADLSEDDRVLEVGPGIGTLTVALCEAAGEVVAVEADRALLPVLEETTMGCDALTLVHADAVRVPAADLTEGGGPTAFVSNLPYSIAARVVLRFFDELPSLGSATVMVQAEVADRMAAGPGSKEYGAYTVKLSLRAGVVGRFEVPRTCFLPSPNVDSSVLRLVRRTAPDPSLVRAADRVATAAFAQRRKTLANSLTSDPGLERDPVRDALSSAGIDPTRRAETLETAEYLEIAGKMRESGLLP